MRLPIRSVDTLKIPYFGTLAVANKIVPYKTDCPDGVSPTALNKAARDFATTITGEVRPGPESGLFIETFKACFQIMQEMGMVKDEYMISEKPVDLDDE